jgi:hypothetical protein
MKRLFALLIFISPLLFGQNSTQIQPDCTVGNIFFSAVGNSSVFDNRPQSPNSGPPCTNWELTYTATTGSPTLSISIQEAPNNNGVPGSFTTITGATSTITPSASILVTHSAGTGYWPFIRVALTALGSGSITATLNGWRDSAASISGGGGGGGSGCPGTISTPCVVIGPTAIGSAPTDSPVQVADVDGAGNVITPSYSTKAIAINLSAVTGANQIIAASGSTIVRITNISVGMTTASTVSITAGTGTNCGTSTTTLWGPYPSNTTAFAQDFAGILVAPAGDAVCLNFGGTVTAGGGVSYSQY